VTAAERLARIRRTLIAQRRSTATLRTAGAEDVLKGRTAPTASVLDALERELPVGRHAPDWSPGPGGAPAYRPRRVRTAALDLRNGTGQ
jgi:hypothetical protein